MGLEPPVEPILNHSLGDFGHGASQRDGSVRADFGGGLVLLHNGDDGSATLLNWKADWRRCTGTLSRGKSRPEVWELCYAH